VSERQHALNGLHVYCRLMDLGLPRAWARRVSRLWERLAAWALYPGAA